MSYRALLLIAVLGGCGDDTGPDDAAVMDGGADAGVDAGSDGGVDAGLDATTEDASASCGDAAHDAYAPDPVVDEHDFPLRTPRRGLPIACEEGYLATADEIDHVCTLTLDGHDLLVYVQADPTGVIAAARFAPLYEDVRAWVYDNATGTTTMVEAAYDYGFGHHNDFIDVHVGGQHYRYYHSSFGHGFRACAPPDCVQKLDAAGTVIDDGCQQAVETWRTHPEVCVALREPVVPPLMDTFERCDGDPYAE
jgi:hypothetical protein